MDKLISNICLARLNGSVLYMVGIVPGCNILGRTWEKGVALPTEVPKEGPTEGPCEAFFTLSHQ